MPRVNLILAACLLAAGIGGGTAWAQQAAPSPAKAAAATAAETESQQFARTKLMEMAKFLGATKAFSVNLHADYDVVQANGQTIEFGEVRELSVQRPNQVRIEQTGSDGGQNLMLFDSKTITMFDSDTGAYAQAPQPGDIDASAVYFVRDLKMRLPLAPLFMEKFADELQQRIQSIEYVERTGKLGQPAHHIAARTAKVDFQVWIADGKRPLPLRIVLTYPKQEGQPQFRADLSDWNLSPRFNKATFAFKPPADAKPMVFAVQVPTPAPQPAQNQGGKP